MRKVCNCRSAAIDPLIFRCTVVYVCLCGGSSSWRHGRMRRRAALVVALIVGMVGESAGAASAVPEPSLWAQVAGCPGVWAAGRFVTASKINHTMSMPAAGPSEPSGTKGATKV